MNCKEYEQLLMKYESGEICAEELEKMNAHEAVCPACAAMRRQSDEIMAGLVGLRTDVPEMPKDFHAKWTSAVKKERRKPVRILRIAGVAAACLVTVIIALSAGAKLSRGIRSRAFSNEAAVEPVLGFEMAASDSYSMSEEAEFDFGTDNSYSASALSSSPAYARTYNTAGIHAPAAGSGVPELSMEAGETEIFDDEFSAEPAEEKAALPVNDKKIIRSASMDITTADFDTAFESLSKICNRYDGWTSQSSVTTSGNGLKRANINMRIPSKHLDDFLNGTAGIGRVNSRNETAEDVTENYRDTQTRLKTQQMLLERLQSLVTTTTKLNDLLALEDQIADKQYEIDRLTTSLIQTDKLVEYSEVSITLREEQRKEVAQAKTVSFGERILAAFEVGIESFISFLEDLLLLFVAALPYLICLAVLIFIVVIIIRRVRHRRTK